MSEVREKKFRIAEVFGPTIQGEGRNVGMPCHFVRLGGCDFRCTWCDTPHAVLPDLVAQLPQMTVEEIFWQVLCLQGRRSVDWIVLTGGNPALFDLSYLITRFHEHGFLLMLETQGTVFREWMLRIDDLCFSPKPPSAGNETDLSLLKRILEKFEGQRNQPYLKVPIFGQADYEYARATHEMFPRLEMFLSPGNSDPGLPTVGNPDPDPQFANRPTLTRDVVCTTFKYLTEKMVMDPVMRDVRIFPQQHVLAWGNVRGH